ncbi:type II toxin-antitoxin system RelB family antitoxin [Nesterenkonia alba]|uniref:type II toxin-antitoxin system RelB family antitoxin n=1 Tax=Nesterenkonia alba TaxID=515814 RepID=UPI0003B75694|nr:ribbon-helix-helix protein, CopG family [Nesterenkonia alba]
MSTVLDFDPETDARLERIAARTGQSKSELARELVTSHVAELEEAAELREHVEAIRQGEVPTVSDEEVGRRLGLDD